MLFNFTYSSHNKKNNYIKIIPKENKLVFKIFKDYMFQWFYIINYNSGDI